MPFVKSSPSKTLPKWSAEELSSALTPRLSSIGSSTDFDAHYIYPAEHLAAWAERAGYDLGIRQRRRRTAREVLAMPTAAEALARTDCDDLRKATGNARPLHFRPERLASTA